MNLLPGQAVDQTKMYDGTEGSGNCVEACVATMFGIPLDEVPTFFTPEVSGSQVRAMETFFADRGYELLLFPPSCAPDCTYIASGSSSRNTKHMVVMNAGNLLHDPHPSREGILGIDYILVPVPTNLALLRKVEQ